MKHWIYIEKNFKKVALYGSITALFRDNDINIKDNKATNEYTLRRAIINEKYEDKNIYIERCELKRSTIKNKY